MTISSVINGITNEKAQGYLRTYYGLQIQEHPKVDKPPYAGSYFESMDRDIWENYPDRITGSDLYALSTLQISVPRTAGVGILGAERTRITELLAQIPDVKLEELSSEKFDRHLGPDSPAQALWDLLCRNKPGDSKWGVGATTASKIMARKRPGLIPIQDSVVDGVISRGKNNAWELWWQAFREDKENKELVSRAETFREHIADLGTTSPQLSTLRIFDVVLWMFGREQKAQTYAS